MEDVQAFEIENIVSEWYGAGDNRPSHHELLLRMGESLGVSRDAIYKSEPLPATKRAIMHLKQEQADVVTIEDASSIEGMINSDSWQWITSIVCFFSEGAVHYEFLCLQRMY